MDEIEVGQFKTQKNQFSFGKRTQVLPNKASKVPKTELNQTMASAEEKFDALFSASDSRKLYVHKQSSSEQLFSAKAVARKFSAPKRTNKVKLDPLEKITKKTNLIVKPEEPKKVHAKPLRSPFSLAFGTANSDDDSDGDITDFGDSGVTSKKTAEETWDEMMSTFDKEPKTEKKTVKLSALVRRKNTDNKGTEIKVDKKDNSQDPEKIEDPYDEFDSKQVPNNYDDFNKDLEARVKPCTPPPEEPNKKEETTQASKGREKRFFKGRTKEAKQNLLHNFTLSEEKPDVNLFKKPVIPAGNPIESVDLRVPETARLTDDQIGDKEHADDLRNVLNRYQKEIISLKSNKAKTQKRYYLEGMTTSSHARALTASSFAKKCSRDQSFLKFLGTKKIKPSEDNPAHNMGHFFISRLRGN